MILTLLSTVVFAAETPVNVGAGLFFNAGGTFMTEPTDKTQTVNGAEIPLLASGWGGYGSGAGLAFDVRAAGFIGLEIDLVYRSDHARTKFTIDNVDFPFEARQSALHIPVMAKLIMPTGPVRPNLFGGFEFVLPGDPTITQADGLGIPFAAHSENYTMSTFGFGFEIVPPVTGLDMRFPLTFRGSYNGQIPDEAEGRADYDVDFDGSTVSFNEIDFLTVWEWHAAVTIGVSFYFM